eukprot:jgi/Chrzof1/376/Cz01g13190.t1
MACTACWLAYGFAANNVFMFGPNLVGFVAATHNTVACYGLATHKPQNLILAVMTTAAALIPFLGIMSSFVIQTPTQRTLLWGITANLINVAYYAAPLSRAWRVISSRNSTSLYMPMCIANLVNAVLWAAYGFAVMDFFIHAPNTLGAALGLFRSDDSRQDGDDDVASVDCHIIVMGDDENDIKRHKHNKQGGLKSVDSDLQLNRDSTK